MEETIINTEPEGVRRPGFLKTLCILTFIGAGLMILLSLFGAKDAFMSPDERAMKMTEDLASLAETHPEMADNIIEGVMENQQYALPNWIIGMLGNILTLIAAIMMWNLRRVGYYLYCAAELIPSILMFGFFGGVKTMNASMSMFGDSAGTGLIIAFLFFDLLFIVLYGLNLKHMKR